MEPKDPLTNATLSVPESERIASTVPEAYRLKVVAGINCPYGYILQGAFKTWNEQGMIQYEWRDIPTHIED